MGVWMRFKDLSASTMEKMRLAPGFTTDGQWLAAVAAFVQIVSGLEDSGVLLERCRDSKNDVVEMR